MICDARQYEYAVVRWLDSYDSGVVVFIEGSLKNEGNDRDVKFTCLPHNYMGITNMGCGRSFDPLFADRRVDRALFYIILRYLDRPVLSFGNNQRTTSTCS